MLVAEGRLVIRSVPLFANAEVSTSRADGSRAARSSSRAWNLSGMDASLAPTQESPIMAIGILVQLPLPGQFGPDAVVASPDSPVNGA